MSAVAEQVQSTPAFSAPPALKVEGVNVRFGGLSALSDVSISAAAGEITGLIGPNGAGKTTLFNVITGLQKPQSGRVSLGDRNVTRLKPHQRARLGFARTFQRLEVFSSLSVLDNVRTAAEVAASRRSDGMRSVDLARELVQRVGITDHIDRRVDELSTGHARLVELARALATAPRVLLLDEPGSGLDDAESIAFGELLVDLARTGLSILIVEHDVDLVMRICDQICVLDFGQIIASGTPAEVRTNSAVQAAYLGGENG
ncbi:MAG: ABC transporter ATP-binding protein [Acidimicrobiia bacterium]